MPVYAGDSNQTTNNSSSSGGVAQGSSIVASSNGTYKVTLYFATKPIENIETASMSDFYQWGRPFFITSGIKGSAAGRTSHLNNKTSKLSQIGGGSAPGLDAFRSTSDIKKLSSIGLPNWSNGSTLNDSGVRNFFAGKVRGKDDPGFTTLSTLIGEGAKQFIGGSSTYASATNALIDRYKNLGVFSEAFMAAHPELGYFEFVPTSEKWAVSWLVIMEPCFHFIPKNNGGKSFILTPTDGNLANAAVSSSYIIKNPFSRNIYNNWNVDGSYMIFSSLLEEGAGFQPEYKWLSGKINPKPAGSKAFTGYANTTPSDVVRYGGYAAYFYKANDEGTITVTPVYKDTDIIIPEAVIKEKEQKLPDGKGQTVYTYEQYGDYPFTGEVTVEAGHDDDKKPIVYTPVEDKVATVTPEIPSVEVVLEFDIPRISVIVVDKETRDVIPGATITETHDYFDDRLSKEDPQIYYYGEEYGDYTYEASLGEQKSEPVTVTVTRESPNADVVLELETLIDEEFASSPNLIEENELTKGFTIDVDFSSASWKHNHDEGCKGGTKACPGTHRKKKKKGGYRYYSCGATWKCSDYSAKILSEHYWDFDYIGGARPELSALHLLSANPAENDGVSLVFNKTGGYSVDTSGLKDIYKDITKVSFVGHRSTDANFIQPLAAYMNNTEVNKTFLDFIKNYISNYPSLYEKPNAYADKSYILKYSTKGFDDVSGKVKLTTSCSKASSPKYQGINGTIGSSSWQKTINVNKTYIAPAKANQVEQYSLLYKDIHSDYNKKGSSVEIRIPAEPINFYPAFQMDYAKSHSETSPNNKVWILADGKRTFNGMDFIKVKLTKNELELSSQWSRDREDRYDANGNLSDVAVAKSGSMLKGEGNGSTITIDVYYHVQDPAFCENKAAAQAKVDKIAATYNAAVDSMINKLKSDGTSFYSNLWDSTDANTLLKVPTPSKVQSTVSGMDGGSLVGKTLMKVTADFNPNVNKSTTVYFVDNDSKTQYPGSRNISLNGESVAISDRWEDNGVITSTEKLDELLIENESVRIARKWYNETYEGVLVVHQKYIVKLDGLAFDYAQIHPYHSDFKTLVNATAKEIKFYYEDGQGSSKKTLIEGDTFGVGMEFRLGNFTIQLPSKSYPVSNVFIASPPATFSIRGSIYDIK